MNGWQRIGIVAFAAWTIVGSGLTWRDLHNQAADIYQVRLSGCQGRYDAAPTDKYEAYQLCFKEADEKFDAEWADATHGFREIAPFVIVIPAVIVWGLISVAIVTARWVKKGFERQG